MSAEPRRRLLLVVADAEARGRLSRGLREHGYGVHSAGDIASAEAILAGQPIDLIVAECEDGADALQPYLRAGPTLIVLGRGRVAGQIVEQAQAVLAAGAYDYLAEPVSAHDIVMALEKAAAREARRGDAAAARFLPASSVENTAASVAESTSAALPTLVFQSARMKSLLEKVRKLAAPRTPVLLTGESGTGKEVLARTLHALSPRRDGPLVAVNCAALPETLLESLLFGHRRGAFTDAVRDQRGLFEDAHRGSLFLDEVGELSPQLQVKLLRVLQDQKIQPLGAGSDEAITVDVRLIAATLRNLEADVESGRFRADLYYRLSVVPLHVPPLRERVDDILPLARYFLRRAAERFRRPLAAFTPAAEERMLRHTWPGNVRELENTIERAAVLCDGTVIDAADLPLHRVTHVPSPSEPVQLAAPEPAEVSYADDLSVKAATQRLEASLIQRALDRTRGNRSAAARLLGLSHRALLYKLRDYGLDAAAAASAHDSDSKRVLKEKTRGN